MNEAYLALKDKFAECDKTYPPNSFFVCLEACVVPLTKQDKIFYNFDFVKFSVVPLEGYKCWSQQIKEELKGYDMDVNNKFISLPDTSRVNFNQLLKVLRSKDLDSEEVRTFD